jgi:hypothetical protein
MYGSLEKLDLAVAFPGTDLAYLVQGDHRDPGAISAEAPLSVIFAIVRCLAARAAAAESGRPFRVIYQLDGEAPAFLQFVVAAAGGTIAREIDASLATAPDRAPQAAQLETLMADACAHLAADVWKRERLEPTLGDLVAFERRYHYRSDRHADEIDYYTRLVTLGALAASVLTPHLAEARWRPASGVVPFVLSGRRAGIDAFHIDVFGKAERFLEHGNSEAPSGIVGALLGASVGVDEAFPDLEPAELEARALAGAADDLQARATAEALARAAADALRAWGLPIGNAVRWVTRPIRETDLRPIGTPVLTRVRAGHRGFDGEREIVDSMTPYREALARAIARHHGFDGSREDWFSSVDFRSACVLRLRVPDDDGPFAGRRVAELPDPFTPLLAVWRTGYVVDAMDESGTTLLIVASSSPAS